MRTWVAAAPVERGRPLAGDLLLALGLAAIGAVTAVTATNGSRAGLVLLALAATLPLAARRLYPVPVLGIVTAATALAALVFGSYWPLGVAVALYGVAAHSERRRALAFGAACLLVLVVPIAHASEWRALTFLRLAPLVAAWILGDSLRTRRAYLRAVEERAEQLEREQDSHARRAAAEEQARIAREVHDVVAHNLSVIVVQATAADVVFESRPDDARRAVRTIEGTARQALDELRRVLAVVQEGERLAPQPSLARLVDLVEQVRAAVLRVELDVVGEERELPAALELSAYRIVQEALTNTLRHADATRAAVTVAFEPDALRVEVVDDGRTEAAGGGDGHGLAGMRERAATFGGELATGPMLNGGFRVAARLPLTAASR